MATETTTTTTTTTPRLLTPTSTTPLPTTLWWNTNLPPLETTPTCPSYLLYATHNPKERANLSTPDALFTRKSWPQVRCLIAANRLDQFTRVPSELRQYRRWTEGVVREYGSMMAFILKERLGWDLNEKGMGVGAGDGRRFGCKGMSYSITTTITSLNPKENLRRNLSRLLANLPHQRKLQNPPQRLALRPRHAHCAPRRLDEIPLFLGPCHG